MARIRTIKPDFFKSEQVGELDPINRLLFIGLWTLADCEGKLLDRPKRIKAELFPYDNHDVDQGLQQLERVGLILRYKIECTETFVIKIVNFHVHQRITGKEAMLPSEIPDPNQTSSETHARQGGNNGETTGKTEIVPGVSQMPRKGKEGKGRERKGSRENAIGEIFNDLQSKFSEMLFQLECVIFEPYLPSVS